MADDGHQLPKDAGQAATWAETARNLWRDRDQRFDEEECAWALEQPPLEATEQSFQLATAATQVNKPSRMMSGVDLLLEVAPETEDSRPAAQRIEDFGRWAWDEACTRHTAATGHQLLRSINHYINLRGWFTYTLMLNVADPSFPFKTQLLDSRQVYPDTLNGEPCATFHRYRSTVRELLYQFPTKWVVDALGLGDPANAALDTTPVDCIGCYTPYETAFLVNGQWLKPPEAHDYGFSPLVRVYREGTPGGATGETRGLSQPSRLIGTGHAHQHPADHPRHAEGRHHGGHGLGQYRRPLPRLPHHERPGARYPRRRRQVAWPSAPTSPTSRSSRRRWRCRKRRRCSPWAMTVSVGRASAPPCSACRAG